MAFKGLNLFQLAQPLLPWVARTLVLGQQIRHSCMWRADLAQCFSDDSSRLPEVVNLENLEQLASNCK